MAGEDIGNETLLHPAGLLSVLFLGILVVLVPRRFAILPMVVLACFIPSAQRLVVAGLDFDLLRILVLFGWFRLMVRKELSGYGWNRLDSLVMAWMTCGTVVYVLQHGSFGALVNRLGWMFDGCGMYFFCRCVIREWADLERVGWCFAIVSLPVAMAFLLEQFTGRNVFSVFGGVPATTWVREGRLRCQGAFAHAILAGSFWASVLPIMLALWWQGRRWLVSTGAVAVIVIIFTCASSTPVLGVGFVMVGMALYPLRHHLRPIRWGSLACLVLLHLVMKQPVWHLMARVSAVGGSTGWHRFKIMDATIHNADKWLLLGEPNPMSWGVSNMSDVTNQYILEALRGGLLTLLLFIAMLGVAFGMVGQSIRAFEKVKARQLFVWCLGVALFVHVGTFFGVSYFGQIIMLVYLTLAMVGSIHSLALAATQNRGTVPTQDRVEDLGASRGAARLRSA